jgi:hypothetical protein
VVAVVGLVSGMLLEWVRARGARSVATLQLTDSRERRLQEASDALIDDYRQRLADARTELAREVRLRRALGRALGRLERARRRKHVHRREHRGTQ